MNETNTPKAVKPITIRIGKTLSYVRPPWRGVNNHGRRWIKITLELTRANWNWPHLVAISSFTNSELQSCTCSNVAGRNP